MLGVKTSHYNLQMWVHMDQTSSRRRNAHVSVMVVPQNLLKANPPEFESPCSCHHGTGETEMVAPLRERDEGKCMGVAQPLGLCGSCGGWALAERCVQGQMLLCHQEPVLLNTLAGTKITCMTYGVTITLIALAAELQPCFPTKMQNQAKKEKETALGGRAGRGDPV